MFGPFIFWKGGSKPPQELAEDAMYPRRYGGMSPPAYQQQYNSDPRINQQNLIDMRSMPAPGYVVTGRIVED